MNYLLDTHAVWSHASDGEGLSARADELLMGAPVSQLHMLDVSLYELARHMELGTIKVESPLDTLNDLESAYSLIHTDATIAWRSIHLSWQKKDGKGQHRDPADRAIMAAAIDHDLTIITADQEMHHQAEKLGVRVLW